MDSEHGNSLLSGTRVRDDGDPDCHDTAVGLVEN